MGGCCGVDEPGLSTALDGCPSVGRIHVLINDVRLLRQSRSCHGRTHLTAPCDHGGELRCHSVKGESSPIPMTEPSLPAAGPVTAKCPLAPAQPNSVPVVDCKHLTDGLGSRGLV